MEKFRTIALYIIEVFLLVGVLATPMPHSTRLAFLIMQEEKSPSVQTQNDLEGEKDKLKHDQSVIKVVMLSALAVNSFVIYRRKHRRTLHVSK